MKTFIALLLCTVSAFARESPAEKNISEALTTAGISLAARGQYEQAETMFYKAVILNETNIAATCELAKLCDKKGRTEEAAQWYQKVFALADEGEMKILAAKRVSALNPIQGKLNELLKGYASELTRIGKQSELTREVVLERANQLGLSLPALEFNPIGKWSGHDKLTVVFCIGTVTTSNATVKGTGTWKTKNNIVYIAYTNEWGNTQWQFKDNDTAIEGQFVYTRQK